MPVVIITTTPSQKRWIVKGRPMKLHMRIKRGAWDMLLVMLELLQQVVTEKKI